MKLTLGKKLGLGFVVILALMVVSTVLIYLKASAEGAIQGRISSSLVPTVSFCKDLQRDLNQAQNKGRQVILAATEPKRREAAKKLFDAAWGDIGKDVARLDELAPFWALQENRDRLADLKKQLPLLRESQELILSHAASGEHDAIIKAGNEFTDKATTATEAVKKPLGETADSVDVQLRQDSEAVQLESRSMYLTLGLTTLVALGVGVFVASFMSRKIAGATRAVLAQAEAIAAGDLTRDDMEVRSQDELGDLTTAINKMSGSLKP